MTKTGIDQLWERDCFCNNDNVSENGIFHTGVLCEYRWDYSSYIESKKKAFSMKLSQSVRSGPAMGEVVHFPYEIITGCY